MGGTWLQRPPRAAAVQGRGFGDLKEVYFMDSGRMKQTALLVLSIGSLAVGALGIADVNFFSSNNGLGLIQIMLGVGGLIIAVR